MTSDEEHQAALRRLNRHPLEEADRQILVTERRIFTQKTLVEKVTNQLVEVRHTSLCMQANKVPAMVYRKKNDIDYAAEGV